MSNPQFKWNWRKKKKFVRNRSDKIEALGYFEDCNYHPCKVTEIFPYRSSQPWTLHSSYVDGVSLITGEPTGCSMFHCAPLPLTEKEATERAEYAKEHGMLAYLKKYIYGPMTEEQEKELEEFYQGREL